MIKVLENSFIKRFGYDLANKIIILLIQTAVIIVLATILSPNAFGIVGLSMVFISFFNIFSTFGFENSFVYFEEDKDALSSLFIFTVFLGLFLGIIGFISAEIIADLYNKEELKITIQLLSINFPLISGSILFKAFLTKRLDIKSLAIIEVTSVFIGGIVGIILALLEFSFLSLVLMHLVQTFLKSVGYAAVSIAKGFNFQFQSFSFIKIKEYIYYSLNVVFFGIINFISKRIDILILGKILSSEQLGYYSLAYDLIYRPTSQIAMAFNRVLFPTLNNVKESFQKVKNYYINSLKGFFSTFSLLLIIVISILSILIYFYYFDKWGPIIPLLFIFTIISIRRFIVTSGGSIILISGKPQIQWKIALFINIPLSIIGIFVGYYYFPYSDIINVAIGYVIFSSLGAIPSFRWSLTSFNISPLEVFKHIIMDILVVLVVFVILTTTILQYVKGDMSIYWMIMSLLFGFVLSGIKIFYSYKKIEKLILK